jgi:hypothetical protein
VLRKERGLGACIEAERDAGGTMKKKTQRTVSERATAPVAAPTMSENTATSAQ